MIVLIFVIIYIYIGYPFVIWFIGRYHKKEIIKKDYFPKISIITAAYNEEDDIENAIKNKLSLDYPNDRFEIILVSDESSDKTDDIINKYVSSKVKFIRQTPRAGKTAAINRAITESNSEILVFADANSIYDENAIKELSKNFYDPTVGYVTGKMIYINESGNVIGDGNTKYMKYENWLRKLETNIGSIVGVDGGVDAVRRDLYKKMPKDALPDFYLPLNIIESGYRVIFEENAILKEVALNKSQDEFKMRVRVSLRAFHTLWAKSDLLNPFKYGIFSIQLISHKLLRYLVGLFQILIFIGCFILYFYSNLWKALFFFQIVFYIITFISFILEKYQINNPISTIFYFNLLNYASLVALIKFLRGEKQVIWNPRKGN
jgi:cellulose synthase/poly-beta-1,6-N-acetylglucosamine synthase-like glycosyltransferase